ncbi:MAG TPA: Holliday junction resolvase RuvX [Pseudonocardia sp.]
MVAGRRDADLTAPDQRGPDGRRIGVDVGSVRVGVALGDPSGMIATPLATLRRDERDGSDLRQLAEIVAEYEVVEVVIGLPRTLADREGPAAVAARGYADALTPLLTVPVRMVDERLSTVVATRALREAGVRGRKQRGVVDQAAAVAILQGFLDSRRSAGGGSGR